MANSDDQWGRKTLAGSIAFKGQDRSAFDGTIGEHADTGYGKIDGTG